MKVYICESIIDTGMNGTYSIIETAFRRRAHAEIFKEQFTEEINLKKESVLITDDDYDKVTHFLTVNITEVKVE